MAVIDRLRERLRGQQPIGAAEEMQRGGPAAAAGGMTGGAPAERGGRGGSPVPLQHNALTEMDLQSMERGPTN